MGMTRVSAGTTRVGVGTTRVSVGMTRVSAGMARVVAGMMESPTCCGPGAIHAAKVNGIQFQEMLY